MEQTQFNDLCYRLMSIKAMIDQSREKTTAYLNEDNMRKMNMQVEVSHRLITMYFGVVNKLNKML